MTFIAMLLHLLLFTDVFSQKADFEWIGKIVELTIFPIQ